MIKPADVQSLAISGAVVVGVGALLYWWSRGTKGTASDIVGVAGGVVTGTIDGLGEAAQGIAQAVLGVPKTNSDECAADMKAGDTWGASFSCPAGTFIKYLAESGEVNAANPLPPRPVTAPGGGIVDASYFSVINPRYSDCMPSFENPAPCPVAGTDTNWMYNTAPTDRPQLVRVAGLRG